VIKRAIDIALAAGEILNEKLSSGVTVEHKGRIDLVTDADRAAEEFIVQQLERLFPRHGVLGEEGTQVEGSSDYLWVIDPVDGTTNFAHGFPYFAVSLGLLRGDDVVLGVVYNPQTKECFAAEKGSGALLNGRKISVSAQSTLEQSLLATGFPYNIDTAEENNLASFARANLITQGVRSLGAASLDLCQVAAGRLDAFWERSLEPWDIAAGSIIVREARGKVTSCQGQTFRTFGREICASNGLIHEGLVRLLSEVDR
jgi:myo-inositol-1(or 4)-monophosphatase